MCGIVGVIQARDKPILTNEVLQALRHRGPDGSGEKAVNVGDKTVWFGHTRLAIQDLTEAGAQPMASADGRWLLTFNGEIYNHQEMRRELDRQWRGHSDTETLVEALTAWGVDATIRRLNGIFAFGALDLLERKLYLVRDPFGVKPLYFADTAAGFGFSSEIRALAAVTGQRFGLDRESLNTYLSLRFVPSPHTLLKGVQRLPAAHVQCRHLDSGETHTHCYVQAGQSLYGGSLDEATQLYQSAVSTAVRRQLLSDVPVGILLSGGIDSALVAAMALDAGVKTPCFTVGYQEAGPACEIDDAAHTAKTLGLSHHVVRLGHEDLWGALESAVAATEEPLVTTSALPMWFLCKRAREDVAVVLTGQGSDELLGGYKRYQGELVRKLPLFSSTVSLLRPLLDSLPGVSDAVLRSAHSASIVDVPQRFEREYGVFSAASRLGLTGRADAGRTMQSIQQWLDWSAKGRPLTDAEQMMSIDMRMGLADDLLLYGDKVSMAHSIEARVPLLDTELVRLVESFPAHYKLSLGKSKIIHKRMAERYLPEAIVHRPKKGFQVPVGEMVRGAWRDRCEGLLFEGATLAELGVDSRELRRLWDEHQRRFRDRSREIFALLGLVVWRREMADLIA